MEGEQRRNNFVTETGAIQMGTADIRAMNLDRESVEDFAPAEEMPKSAFQIQYENARALARAEADKKVREPEFRMKMTPAEVQKLRRRMLRYCFNGLKKSISNLNLA